MTTGAVAQEDPRRGTRVGLAAVGTLLFVLGAVTSDAIILYDDGSHGPALTDSLIKGAILLVVGAGGYLLALQPHRPDVRVVRAAMLAIGLVGLMVGLDAFVGTIEARGDADGAVLYPGIAPWSLLGAAAIYLYLRWNAGLWPESRWNLDVAAAAAKRRR